MLMLANIFQPLIDIFEPVLKFFHDSLGVSWGWSIVLLTVAVRAILIPLTFKQFHSMQKLQRLAPELKAIQQKYKDDKQRQQQEVMKFYRENDVNPFASCLPLLAQLPVFIGLYYTLRTKLRTNICPKIQTAFQARYQAIHHVSAKVAAGQTTECGAHHGAGFLFIPDMTNKATGLVLVVLIVLYVGTQLASTLLMSSPTMDKTQRQIMLLMPLFFVIIILSFPAGVIVYWITTNAWTIFQQYFVRRRLGPMVPAAPSGGVGGADGAGPGRGDGGGPRPNGAGSGGGLGALLRGRQKTDGDKEPAGVGAASRPRREAPPPPPPRKKKKRSGRRR
jgi:YidC/Oxa1 family membrane protein insertase